MVFISAGSVRPPRLYRLISDFTSTPCPKKIKAGRSASTYTQSPRLAKNARRSWIAAIVHACLARAENDRLGTGMLLASDQVLVQRVHVLVGRHHAVDSMAVERD